MTDMPDYLDTAQVARTFAVTSETIRNWITDGKFPNHRRVGRKWLIPDTDVRALLESTYGDKATQP